MCSLVGLNWATSYARHIRHYNTQSLYSVYNTFHVLTSLASAPSAMRLRRCSFVSFGSFPIPPCCFLVFPWPISLKMLFRRVYEVSSSSGCTGGRVGNPGWVVDGAGVLCVVVVVVIFANNNFVL